jgi:hypothetical protein
MKKSKKDVMGKLFKEVRNKYRPSETQKVKITSITLTYFK